jgi:hypothetical protein
MIELTPCQVQAIERSEEETTRMVNPQTQETFVLVPQNHYDRMQKWIAPLKRRWDHPGDEDLTRKPS